MIDVMMIQKQTRDTLNIFYIIQKFIDNSQNILQE